MRAGSLNTPAYLVTKSTTVDEYGDRIEALARSGAFFWGRWIVREVEQERVTKSRDQRVRGDEKLAEFETRPRKISVIEALEIDNELWHVEKTRVEGRKMTLFLKSSGKRIEESVCGGNAEGNPLAYPEMPMTTEIVNDDYAEATWGQ